MLPRLRLQEPRRLVALREREKEQVSSGQWESIADPRGELDSSESLATKPCYGGAGFRRGRIPEAHLPGIM